MSYSGTEEQSIGVALVLALLFALLTAGCAGVEYVLPSEPPQTGATTDGDTAAEPGVPPAMLPTTRSAEQSATQADAPGRNSSTTVPASPAPIEQPGKKETAASAAGQSVPKTNPTGTNPTGTNPTGAKIPAKVSAPPAPLEQPQKTESAAPALEKQQASPPLDLASLENRLKQTKAIGVFSKLALKNQIDDLLTQFRAYYQGHLKTTLAQLRQRYDLLLLKVLTLLQDSDQSLATAIGASREAIWAILANRQTFATI